jgi:plasmid stabilization system protein ParE
MEANEPFQVEFSEEAIDDLEQIKVFLTRLFSFSVAQRSVDEVFERCMLLEQFPHAGRRE